MLYLFDSSGKEFFNTLPFGGKGPLQRHFSSWSVAELPTQQKRKHGRVFSWTLKVWRPLRSAAELENF